MALIELGKSLLVEFEILGSGIKNEAQGFRNAANDWNRGYKSHWQRMRNLSAWNQDSKLSRIPLPMRDPSDNVTRNAKTPCGLMRLGTSIQWRTVELGTVWKSPSKQLLHRTLLLRTIFCSALGSSRRPPTSPNNVVVKKALIIFTHFAPNSTLFVVEGKWSLVLVISLERSQHFWPPL